MKQPPGEVLGALQTYLREVDSIESGLIEALYVTGSVALEDYQPGISDIDVVALCGRPLPPHVLQALPSVHRPSRPSLDVLYATRDDLARNPAELSLPHSLLGTFSPTGAFAANPVTWRELVSHSVPVRGRALADDQVWFEPQALRAWNLSNLDGYWADILRRSRAARPSKAAVRHEYGLQWVVLGIPRLHYTIVTSDVTSKTGAGRYALDIVPAQWRLVLETAMELRRDPQAGLRTSAKVLWKDACDLADWLIADAHRVDLSGRST